MRPADASTGDLLCRRARRAVPQKEDFPAGAECAAGCHVYFRSAALRECRRDMRRACAICASRGEALRARAARQPRRMRRAFHFRQCEIFAERVVKWQIAWPRQALYRESSSPPTRLIYR